MLPSKLRFKKVTVNLKMPNCFNSLSLNNVGAKHIVLLNVNLFKDKLYIFKICDLVQFVRRLNC